MTPVNVAIAGLGNVASALIQGCAREARVSGRVTDIVPVLAFDVHSGKVGLPIREAIRLAPNCATWLNEEVIGCATPVLRGPLCDGLCPEMHDVVPVDETHPAADLVDALRRSESEVLVVLLPTGAQRAAEAYSDAAIQAGVAVVNGMPAHIAKHPQLAARAAQAAVPIIGDDVKSQVGATIIHRALMDVFRTRGGRVNRTLQLDWGGDTDFLNLVKGRRYEEGKRESKTKAVTWNQPETLAHISACDYIPFLGNTKEAYTRLEGTIFGGASVRVDVFMAVEDAYNSAGIIAQAVRCAALAKRAGRGGVLAEPSAWFCKHPVAHMSDADALSAYQQFVRALESEV